MTFINIMRENFILKVHKVQAVHSQCIAFVFPTLYPPVKTQVVFVFLEYYRIGYDRI